MKDMQVDETPEGVKIRYIYELPEPFDGKEVTVTYTVLCDGKVIADAEYPGIAGAPELPLFGLEFTFKHTQNEFRYYGLGPEENYSDRSDGALYGIYSSDASSNLTDYAFPQACGNRTEARWLEVGNSEGVLKFEALDKPFQFTVLPYNETQLEEARHMEELPKPYYTFVKIMAEQMGVGGDDSWGAQVHDAYRISGDKPIQLRVAVSYENKKKNGDREIEYIQKR